MAELFIELFGEEIPARMQDAAEHRLAEAVSRALAEKGLGGGTPKTWSGPRRLAIAVDDVAEVQDDLHEERRGPRADAPQQAIDGFLKSAGISQEDAEIRSTPKGDFLFAVIERKGISALEILPDLVATLLEEFSWPKSMRWGRSRSRWVRPLSRITVLFDGKAVDGAFDLGGGHSIPFGTRTEGHRMLAPDEIELRGGADYAGDLETAFVIADRRERMERIRRSLLELAREENLIWREDEGLLAEVTGLVEYPHPIMGKIGTDVMELPPEVLIVAMRSHQKYFAFDQTDGGKLAPRFVTIANMAPDTARDATIRAGNERVLAARLADARFFWDQDRKTSLDERLPRLDGITFFEGLGSVGQKAGRLEKLASVIAGYIGADKDVAARAGRLAKADLVTETVGEFPELQGIIGGYLARFAVEEKMADAVGGAVRSHYRPEGPGDDLPETPEGMAVALADKIDTLVGFFSVGAVPTGSKDPYALRRAALGIIRLIVENQLHLPLTEVMGKAAGLYGHKSAAENLLPFLQERFRVWLRDRGIGHDIVSALLRKEEARSDDLLHLFRLAETLAAFLGHDEGKGLLAGYRRAGNILAAEEKKDKTRYDGAVERKLLKDTAEAELHDAILSVLSQPGSTTDDDINRMRALGGIRAPIDLFFEKVTVNDDDPAIRTNRLNLLGCIRAAMEDIADFSKIEG